MSKPQMWNGKKWVDVIVLRKPTIKPDKVHYGPALVLFEGKEKLVPMGAFRNFYTHPRGK